MNICDPIRDVAARQPDAEAIVRRGGATISYATFDRMIDSVGSRLIARGIGQREIVAVDGNRLLPTLVAIFALARIGAAPAPDLMPSGLADSRVDVDPAWLDSPGDRLEPRGGGDDIAVVHASSGTTAQPKYVPVSHAQIACRIETVQRAVPLPPDARVVCVIRPSACYGFDTYLRVLWSGGTLLLWATVDDVADALRHRRVNHAAVNPLWIERLVSLASPGSRPFPALQRVETAGSHLPIPLYEAARERLCPDIWNHYGATEAGCIAAAPMSSIAAHPHAVGIVAPGVEVEAIGDDGVPLSPGGRGRLRARGAGLVDAYLRNDGESADVFRDGWLYTADMGSVSPQGLLTVEGRIGEMINIGGFKVSPRTIEDAALSIDGVRDAAAFGVADLTGITHLWLAVVPEPWLKPDALDAQVRARLGNVTPRYLVMIDAIPYNENGKVMREVLMARVTASRARAV